MSKRILIIGAGFAGMWSALAAARLLDQAGRSDVEVALIAPAPELHVRPRLYEHDPIRMKAPLGEIFAATGIRFIAGMVERIDVEGRQVHVAGAGSDTSQQVIGYDRLVLAAGSRLHCPPIPGLQAHTLNVDQLAAAAELDEHIRSPPRDRPAPGATRWSLPEPGLPASKPQPKCRHAFGRHWAMTPGAHHHGGTQRGCRPDLGPGPRPVITQARRNSASAGSWDRGGQRGCEWRHAGERRTHRGGHGRLTAGARANGLTAQVPGIGTILAACTLTPTCASRVCAMSRHGRLRLCRNGQRGQLRVDVLPARHEPAAPLGTMWRRI